MRETRRRGPELEAAILEAGWEQLAAEGYAGFTFEAVAERARTGKSALYRRWPDKESLLLAVLAHWGFETHPAEHRDTGTLRGDVIARLRSANRLGDNIAALMSTLLGAYFDETRTTPAQLRTRLLGDHSEAMRELVDRAVDRGEVAGPIPDRIVSLPFDLLRHESIMNFTKVPDEVILDIVDTVFMPLVAAGRNTPTPAGP